MGILVQCQGLSKNNLLQIVYTLSKAMIAPGHLVWVKEIQHKINALYDVH